ncbi:hypothetical protein AnigIFM49718_003477 [Aspergillus niger]|nr:hypothetical protein AnigIFM49718_003477 [Aspergillus niger]
MLPQPPKTQRKGQQSPEPALNPFFKKWFCPPQCCKYTGDYFIQDGPSRKFAWFEDAGLKGIVLHEQASWRRMWPSNVLSYSKLSACYGNEIFGLEFAYQSGPQASINDIRGGMSRQIMIFMRTVF